jgi:hypothetical protein
MRVILKRDWIAGVFALSIFLGSQMAMSVEMVGSRPAPAKANNSVVQKVVNRTSDTENRAFYITLKEDLPVQDALMTTIQITSQSGKLMYVNSETPAKDGHAPKNGCAFFKDQTQRDMTTFVRNPKTGEMVHPPLRFCALHQMVQKPGTAPAPDQYCPNPPQPHNSDTTNQFLLAYGRNEHWTTSGLFGKDEHSDSVWTVETVPIGDDENLNTPIGVLKCDGSITEDNAAVRKLFKKMFFYVDGVKVDARGRKVDREFEKHEEDRRKRQDRGDDEN